MLNGFMFEMFTPKKEFFADVVEEVICQTADGELGVLKNHNPTVAALEPGEIKIKMNGEWKVAFNSGGFMEVRPDEVVVFSHMCEWPEDIDEARANAAIERENEQLRNAESLSEYRQTEVELQRMMVMLRVKNKNLNLNIGGK